MPLVIRQHDVADVGMGFRPAGDGPFPAVMLLHGSEGAWSGYSDLIAAVFAAHGLLAVPFGYSTGGNIWNAGDIRDVPVDRTVEALAALRACPLANGRVGIYGGSRGAEHAMLAASLMARDGLGGSPDALALLSPPDVVVGAFSGATGREKGDAGWRAWDPGLRAWTWRGSSEGLMPSTPIEIERYPGPVLIAQGTEDQVWSSDMARRLEARLRAAGRDPEVHWYEGKGHGAWGETANLHWEQVIAFFHRHLA